MLGFAFAWRNEAAFRQELVLAVFLVPAAFWLGRTPLEVAILVASCLFVLIVELVNSAIEAIVDRIGHEQHALAGAAKDMGSAAVLLSLLLLIALWCGIAWERFLA